MKSVFTRAELAERWGCTPAAIANREAEGRIKRCPEVPGCCYSIVEVERCEGLADLPKLSPMERRRLEERVAMQDATIERLADAVQRIEQLLYLAKAELAGVQK